MKAITRRVESEIIIDGMDSDDDYFDDSEVDEDFFEEIARIEEQNNKLHAQLAGGYRVKLESDDEEEDIGEEEEE